MASDFSKARKARREAQRQQAKGNGGPPQLAPNQRLAYMYFCSYMHRSPADPFNMPWTPANHVVAVPQEILPGMVRHVEELIAAQMPKDPTLIGATSKVVILHFHLMEVRIFETHHAEEEESPEPREEIEPTH